MFDALIQYWHLTRDAQYNSIVSQSIQFQQGANGDFLPANQSKAEGNDDESTWALAAMSAAGPQFPDPQGGTAWLTLAENVFNAQAARWDTQSCGGGLRWQLYVFNNGCNYKNTIANGNFFQLAARPARFSGNSTYSDWASKAYNWTTTVGFIDADGNVDEGASTTTNCAPVDQLQFSNSAGTYIAGAAHMYNVSSGGAQWKSALDDLLNRTLDVFFPDGVASEISCEETRTCSAEFAPYKGLLGHWLADTTQVAPYTSQNIMAKLTSSAEAAAKACNGDVCPEVWNGTTSGTVASGLGQQLSALSFVQALLINDVAAPEGGSNATSTNAGSASVGAVVRVETVRMGLLVAGLGLLHGCVGYVCIGPCMRYFLLYDISREYTEMQ